MPSQFLLSSCIDNVRTWTPDASYYMKQVFTGQGLTKISIDAREQGERLQDITWEIGKVYTVQIAAVAMSSHVRQPSV